MNLSSSQLDAIQHPVGPLMIVAGPGSGKTTTLILKMAYAIREKVVAPEKILAITFTQKAAKEIASRAKALQAWGAEGPTITTFHGLAYQMMRAEGAQRGWSTAWEVVAPAQQLAILKETLKKHEGLGLKPRAALLALSRWKNGMDDAPSEALKALFDDYQAALEARGVVDFDDLLRGAVGLMTQFPEVKARWSDRFDLVLVDEYQDTNALQAEWIDQLVEKHRNLTIIGDPDQAIYAFRGANVENFIQFKKVYPEATEIHLAENHRCPREVVHASQALITNNIQRLAKTAVLPEGKEERSIQILKNDAAWMEAKGLVETLQGLVGGADHLNVSTAGSNEGPAYGWGDMAVLVRSNTLAKSLAKTLEDAGIPVQRVGDSGFFDRKEIREFLDKVHAMHRDAEAITFPKEKLSQHFRRLIETLGLKAKYDDGTAEGERRYDRLLELLNFATLYDERSLRDAFDELYTYSKLATPEDQWDDRRDAVTVMTVHAAKGLEFPVVFVAGLEEDLFPYRHASELETAEDPVRVEEERRLFYVAMTRTRERLYLSYATERTQFGEKKPMQVSRFLSELPVERLSTTHREVRPRRETVPQGPQPQMSLF